MRDLGGIESAIAQPQTTFAGQELYSTIESKAAALCFSLVMNHPFVDGNKRVGFAVTDTFLRINGFFLDVEPVPARDFITEAMGKGEFRFGLILDWISRHLKPLESGV